MALSIGKREERQQSGKERLLDIPLMQKLQDCFCDANNVYLVCLNQKLGVVTKAYGSKEELEYIHSIVGMDQHVSLMNKLMGPGIETVLEEDCGTDLMKLCGVSVRMNKEIVATWIVIGVMEQEADDEIPVSMMRTTPERFYKSVEFLEALSGQMFAVKLEEQNAQDACQESLESAGRMEAELRRNETMASVARKMESDAGFDQIVNGILKDVCEYMDIDMGCLLRKNQDAITVDMICEYVKGDAESAMQRWKNSPLSSLPFFNGRPYMISTDSLMPDEFAAFFAQTGIRAGIFLPVEIKGRTAMYLCFCERSKKRMWNVTDIKFVNEVKRIVQNILRKRIVKNSLVGSYAFLETILDNAGCGIYVKDPAAGVLLYTNRLYRENSRQNAAVGMLDSYLEKHPEEKEQNIFRELYSEHDNRWFDFYRTPITWVDGREVELCTIYDVTDKKVYQQKIEKQANNDFLTGLYNRMRCEQDLAYYISQSIEFEGEGALLYIDLDDFKNINDELGRQYGDLLLKTISDSLQQIPGIENSCYRLGGDEFIVILTHHHIALLQQIVDEIKNLFSKPWLLRDTDCYCTMSMGIVRFPTDGDKVEELFQKADVALYDAKCSGKNRVACYDDTVEMTSFKRLDLEKNMRRATKGSFEEFEVYYQPIMDVSHSKNICVGAEALIRWNSSELGCISPSEFIPLAEYLGLINPIGDYVIREACERCKYWNDMGHPEYKVNVNLSVVQLLQKNMVDKIRQALDDTGIMPQNLTLEVTESLAVNDMARMKNVLGELHRLGVRVALDDFGTGFSSLNHIREMPLDVLKIDRCFVTDMGKDDFSSAFVRMVSELAEAIGANVCVEGVETKEQAEMLKKNKIQLLQGFYFGEPMRVEEFEHKYL